MTTEHSDDCVTFRLNGQLLGLPVSCVREVLDHFEVTPVPLAPPVIAGHLNLRGRIVTAIDIRGLVPSRSGASLATASGTAVRPTKAVVIEQEATLYALLVDQTGEVLSLAGLAPVAGLTPVESWNALAFEVFPLAEGLIVILDPAALIGALGGARS